MRFNLSNFLVGLYFLIKILTNCFQIFLKVLWPNYISFEIDSELLIILMIALRFEPGYLGEEELYSNWLSLHHHKIGC